MTNLRKNDQNARVDRKIKVEVKDENDNAPLLQPFDGAVLENSAAALITTIQAVDKDASPQYRQLTYTFEKRVTDDVRSKFTLKLNGELWTTQPLDREETRQYRVPIQVTDGKPEHVRKTIYWITVQDLNDVAPQFDKVAGVYEVQLPENREVGKPTGIKLKYEDPDIVNDFTYQIVQGNEEGKFRIDAAAGEVLVNKPLDFDHPVMDRNFTMRVRLSDGANAPAETDITIAVTNVNDLQPVFERANYTFVVTENTECNTTFGRVSAMDPDLSPSSNQNILYYLSPDELRNFTIGSTSGNLSINGCLDREAAKRSTMILYPRANDEGGRGHDADPATVLVTIIDLNDNHPHIKRPEGSYAVIRENLEPSAVDPIIIQLDDLDNPENGCPCTMEMQASRVPESVREKFTLTPLGRSRYEFRARVKLDREEQKIYQLPMTTRDALGVSGTRYLTIEVGDMNDSPMTDGWSSIKVYNYQGQFSSMVIGSVHVTDLDDHDLGDKTFELDPTTASDVATHFQVDHNSGKIIMLKGTPAGRHVLRIKVQDRVRRETAIGEVAVIVVDLTLDAVMQSGSLRISGVTSSHMLQKVQKGRSLYEHLKREIAKLHDISDEQVDVFSLKDVEGGVDIRYNCHSSPYYTAARLDGLLLQHRRQVEEALGVEILMVDINLCLYERTSPCGSLSCQHTMRPNLTAPLVIASDTTTLVGVDIADDYTCDCGALEPLPSVCFDGFCYNGGTCSVVNNTLMCDCLDDNNYGPRCELMTARFERGFAWYEPPTVCESPSLSMTFETNAGDGVLLYAGPIVTSPWREYPQDFVYVFLNNWMLEAYLDLGSGTANVSLHIERNTARSFQFLLSWDKQEVTFEVPDCGINGTEEAPDPCSTSVRLPGTPKRQNQLLNIQGPLQIGGVASMASFRKLSASYGWSLTPPSVYPFSGCVLELRHNDYLFDLNSTDYSKKTFQPCDAPRTSRVVLGQHSVIIILASLLCLLLLVLVILCLARRGRKTVSYPDLDRELVKETMGGADTEGFGEKDVTTFDLKFLQVTPDGYLVSDEDGRLPDVALDATQKQIPVKQSSMTAPLAPLAKMPEGLSIGDFIKDNKKKVTWGESVVDLEDQDVDDVRHYEAQGDEMSAASLSSLNSGFPSTTGTSGRSDGAFDYRSDWGHRFEKLAQIYGRESEQEDDSEYEFPDIPDVPKNHSLRASLPPGSLSKSPSPSGNTDPNSSSSSSTKDESGSDTSVATAKFANGTTQPVNGSPKLSNATPKLANSTPKLVNGVPKIAEVSPRPLDVAEGRADKVTERPLVRTNKEPVTRKIDYHEPAEVVNAVKSKETWC
ncbi:neural-cadherin-like [Penaeus japonicus]|uniref:neural-cadherin-like n=1 Tax=Penaeus japonicus TaxID=27405 RepID=UPI001C711075|nr:neural-cadherin-like [Penaeus japonicus]